MRWRELKPDLIDSDAGYCVYKDAADSFAAWGPPRSQDISAIREATAAVLKEFKGIDCSPDQLNMTAGRAFLGWYCSGVEARAACDKHHESR